MNNNYNNNGYNQNVGYNQTQGYNQNGAYNANNGYVKCKKCGQMNYPNVKNCAYCGNKMKSNTGLIIGLVLGGVALVGLIFVIIIAIVIVNASKQPNYDKLDDALYSAGYDLTNNYTIGGERITLSSINYTSKSCNDNGDVCDIKGKIVVYNSDYTYHNAEYTTTCTWARDSRIWNCNSLNTPKYWDKGSY